MCDGQWKKPKGRHCEYCGEYEALGRPPVVPLNGRGYFHLACAERMRRAARGSSTTDRPAPK